GVTLTTLDQDLAEQQAHLPCTGVLRDRLQRLLGAREIALCAQCTRFGEHSLECKARVQFTGTTRCLNGIVVASCDEVDTRETQAGGGLDVAVGERGVRAARLVVL